MAQNRARMSPWTYVGDASNRDTGQKDCTIRFGVRQMQAEIDELKSWLHCGKISWSCAVKEEQAPRSQGEAADTDPGFRFASK